jgi:hypothetical protein
VIFVIFPKDLIVRKILCKFVHRECVGPSQMRLIDQSEILHFFVHLYHGCFAIGLTIFRRPISVLVYCLHRHSNLFPSIQIIRLQHQLFHLDLTDPYMVFARDPTKFAHRMIGKVAPFHPD